MTAILAVQGVDKVYMCGDQRVTFDEGEYSDGNVKVHRVNRHVLLGLCGDWVISDPVLQAMPALKRCKDSLAAGRKLFSLLSAQRSLLERDWTVLLVSTDRATEVSQHGVFSRTFNLRKPCRLGIGGIIAEVHWSAVCVVGGSFPGDGLIDAVQAVAKYRVDCGPHVDLVTT